MSKLKVAHIADVHLRTQQYGYKARGLDFFNAFKNAVHACATAGADCILCSGDLFDTTAPASTLVIDQLGEIEELLESRNLRMYVSPGNHDNNEPHWAAAYRQNDIIRVLEPNEVCKIPNKWGTYMSTVTALPWMPPYELREALEHTPKADILMWHGEIKEFTGYPKPDAIEVADFPSGKWQLVAMGDQHVHRLITREDGLIISYPGSTESCSSAEDHNKKAYMYTFSGEDGAMQITDIEDIPFETRPKQKLVLRTEEDVDKACSELVSGALVYCHFYHKLKNVRNRLVTAAKARNLEPVTITMTSFFDEKETTMSKLEHGTVVVSLGQFVNDNTKQYFGEKNREKLTSLSVALLTPGTDRQDVLARYCRKELEDE